MTLKWIRADGCANGACVEVAAMTKGRIGIRSSQRPNAMAILDAEEFEQLRTGTFDLPPQQEQYAIDEAKRAAYILTGRGLAT